ncbi:pyruvate,water dikinase [Thermosporothrix hazakensis]|jgi:pyruvate,water dikinase|uniref:Phosphoenolpyruvate synthase n=2 Tax=Thermosporothrix TaxID=768650 RepID=A0A326U4J6_THEHA|nr:PEP/pyruvate-binding domain-containing protein [Thermosporothrix hazakensis]PZW27933.1 pyruvate,water dikinase [Thermosporothrix hazakensis]BBH86861.1 hypothetical protein KTC_16120 [Thermosporothrix sp. COM3]GCE51157.1 hypothetical protein KTH_60260 [Thermosporothrix hazakensis]
MTNSLLLPFTASSSIERTGGKAYNLSELTRAGFPVPPGFTITTDAYLLITQQLDLAPLLDELEQTKEPERLAELAARMRARIHEAPIPKELEQTIIQAYRQLGPSQPVAVRSSATSEDLPFASFAGQQDTYLNIVGEAAVLDAVRRCWASLWTERAVSYRAKNGIDPHTVRLAVVVQRLIDSRVAGVLFTANPLTGKRRQAVIDASPGLGEAVVSGAVNPDHFVVDTLAGRILERHIGEKQLQIRATAGGGTERVALSSANEACVSDEQIRELARLGQRVEQHYGAPQDIEWSIDVQGKLWLLQARPITTLYPLPADAPDSDDKLRVYFSLNVVQGVFRPFTPLGSSLLKRVGTAIATFLGMPPATPEPTFLKDAGMRLFLDMTTPLRNVVARQLLIALMGSAESRTQPIFKQLVQDKRLSLTRTSRGASLLFTLRILLRLRLPSRILRGMLRPEQAVQMRATLLAELERTLQVPASCDRSPTARQHRGLLRQNAPIHRAHHSISRRGYALNAADKQTAERACHR